MNNDFLLFGVPIIIALTIFGAITIFIKVQANRRALLVLEEKVKRERQIKMLDEWIASTLTKFNSAVSELQQLKKIGFRGVESLLNRFEDTRPKIVDLSDQRVATVECLNSEKIMLGLIVNPLLNESNGLFAIRNKIYQIESFVNGGTEIYSLPMRLAKLKSKIQVATKDYNHIIKKYGKEVWSYNFAFSYEEEQVLTLLGAAEKTGYECKGISSENVEEKEKRYEESLGYMKMVDHKVQLVESRKVQISDAVSYVERNTPAIPSLVGRMCELRSNSDVSSSTKKRIDNIAEDASVLDSKTVNPLEAYGIISAFVTSIEETTRRAKTEISDAERRRRDDEDRRRRREDDDSNNNMMNTVIISSLMD